MIYKFTDFELDSDRRELRRQDRVLHSEPLVLDLLILLIENQHRVLDRDELVEKIWNGRIVSDWAISSRIKRLRKMLGDDGQSQRIIQTLRGRGFRFVQDAQLLSRSPPLVSDNTQETVPERRQGSKQPSIAVLPFVLVSGDGSQRPLVEAIPRELISSLATLRWIKVIAPGSSFRFRGSAVDVKTVGETLDARYCLTGTIEEHGRLVTIDTELCDTRDRQVVWALRKQAGIDEIQALRSEIVANVMTVAELEIPQHEAQLVDFQSAENLDAWSAMHCGFQQMYLFTRTGAARAEQLFQSAVQREPSLARAYAGLSFVKFQHAFMRYTDDTEKDIRDARKQAERAIELQPRDPFANFVMGRCFWLRGDPENSKFWFDRATNVSPNYAMAHYGSSWSDVFTAQYDNAASSAERALDLSPLDPMRPGMTGNLMWVNIARKDFPAAVYWAETAARTPWSHAGMTFFAALANWKNGDTATALQWVSEARRKNPGLSYKNLKVLVPQCHKSFATMVKDAANALGVP